MAIRKEVFRSKRRRLYSLDPNAIAYTAFSLKYISHLLPALLKAASNAKTTTQTEKIVRFEVDMALVSSVDEFKWSRALKHKLEQGVHWQCRSTFELNNRFLICLQTSQAIPRPLEFVEANKERRDCQRITKKRASREEEELVSRIRALQRILPGGAEMSVFELLSEVGSYLACLQLQVDVLRSLVGPQ